MGRGRDAETGGSIGKTKTAGTTGEAVWVLGGFGAGQGAQLVLWGPGQCWGILCDFLPYIPLLLGQEGPASGSPLFRHHLPILAHLSSKIPFVGCQGETQGGGFSAEQSPGQAACLGAKNAGFSPSRHHDVEVLTCPWGCATEEVMGP